MKRFVIFIFFLLGSLFLAEAQNQPEGGMPAWEETSAEEIPQWDTPDRTIRIMTGISRPTQSSVRTPMHRTPRHHHHRFTMRLCSLAAHSGANLTISSNREYFFAHAVLRAADYYVVALRRLII